MGHTSNILIIENELLIIDSFKSALNEISYSNNHLNIRIKTSENYEEALPIIKNSISTNPIDIVILNIDMPHVDYQKPMFVEDFGNNLRSLLPNIKILAFATYCDNYRINNIIDAFDPEVFIIKKDIDYKSLVTSLNSAFEESSYYSKTVTSSLRRRAIHKIILDKIDRTLLFHLSKGIRTKDLTKYVFLSEGGIQKRKRRLKQIFEVEGRGDMLLLESAREKGFI